MIKAREFHRMLKIFDFHIFPRMVGNPMQVPVLNLHGLLLYVRMNNGRNPVFISHNAYPSFTPGGKPEKVYVKNLVMDLDSDFGATWDDIREDARKVYEFGEEEDIPVLINFSGGGLHPYLKVKGKIHLLDSKFRLRFRFLHQYIYETLELKSVNKQCAEPKRIIRLPLCRYMRKGEEGYVKKPWYSIPVSIEAVDDARTYPDMIEMARRPTLEYLPSSLPHPKKKFVDLVKEFSIDAYVKEARRMGSLEAFPKAVYEEVEGDFYKIVRELIPFPCMYGALYQPNPRHIIRLGAAIWLRWAGIMGVEDAIQFFDRLAYDVPWKDRHNDLKRENQVRYVYNVSPPYHPISCRRLQEEGFCIGEQCRWWKRARREEGEIYKGGGR